MNRIATILLVIIFIYNTADCLAQAQDPLSRNNGVYLKAGMVIRGFGLSSETLNFDGLELNVPTGSGIKVFFGTGIGTKIFDFELTVEQSLSFGFFATTGSTGSASAGFNMWKTNLYATGLFKVPTKKENYFRFGGGPMLTFPGRLNVKIDGVDQGFAEYESAIGGHFVVDLMISAKQVFIVPGLRLNFSDLEGKGTTFTDANNIDAVSQTSIASINIYMLVIF